jgi:excinuclease ABC subunit C
VRNHFQLRTCDPLPGAVCLRYHFHRCSGICEQHIAADAYQRQVEAACAVLSAGRQRSLIREMQRRMHACADALEFEKAQWLKERIALLESAIERQVVDRMVAYDQDAIYFGECQALVATIRCGALLAVELCELPSATDEADACRSFLLARYQAGGPPELIVNQLAQPRAVAQALSAASGQAMRIILPRGGAGQAIVELCRMNYAYRREAQP